MSKVLQDEIGLYVSASGYLSRPVNGTRFNKGDEVKTHHFSGTPLQGIGKDETCGRGEYLETWIHCGIAYRCKTYEDRKEQYDWYMNYARTTYPLMFKEEA